MKRIPKAIARHLRGAEESVHADLAQVDATLALVHAIREQTEVLADLVTIVRDTTERLAALDQKETP